MKPYLPSATQPWPERIERRHNPTGKCDGFKPCLRWEFGFSCAFCLLHEADLMLSGVHGWTLMQVEHAIPRSQDIAKKDDYSNCFYICQRCNMARGAKRRNDGQGNRLLDPCADKWSDHFERIGDEIRPREGDGSAYYTWSCYGLDAINKVEIRTSRRCTIDLYAETLVEFDNLEEDFFQQLSLAADEKAETILLKNIWAIRKMRERFVKKLSVFSPIPPKPNVSCRCRRTDHHTIPKVLADQTVNLDDLLHQARERLKQAESQGNSQIQPGEWEFV